MKRSTTRTLLLMAGAGLIAFAQSAESRPKFEATDIHVSAKTQFPFVRTGPVRGGRYEVTNATMVDLIRIAYGFDPDKVLGGPSWLELDRFDVTGKLPANSTPESQKLMLQSALEDRFKLAVHKDTKPLPTYALIAGKKPQLKEASGSEETGCRPQAASGVGGEGPVLFMSSPTGDQTRISLGPGMTVQYNCRNMSMAAFAAGLRGMIGASVGPNAVLDETALKGNWNFDLKYSMQMMGPAMEAGDRISIFTAIDKQLGLKLEEKQIPTPVLVVDSVNRTAGENPPGVAEALPPIPLPTEFEVATIKPTDAGARAFRYQMQPGGRLVAEGTPLQFLISRAFNSNNNDQIAGIPPFAMNDRYDINAKAPAAAGAAIGPGMGPMNMDAVAPMVLALLVDRFKMKYHTEERPVSTYVLTAAKPKMKKADPNSRTWCRNSNAPAGAPPGSRVFSCQNTTMALLAERLQNIAPGLQWAIADETGIEGGWDFSLTFSMRAMMVGGRGGPPPPPPPPGGDAGPAGSALPSAADPAGGLTVFEAIEKQLGLKLEKQKKSMPVIVIDHIEQKPTEN